MVYTEKLNGQADLVLFFSVISTRHGLGVNGWQRAEVLLYILRHDHAGQDYVAVSCAKRCMLGTLRSAKLVVAKASFCKLEKVARQDWRTCGKNLKARLWLSGGKTSLGLTYLPGDV
eukprot:CAMPEP_0171715116 /NCGR_PEP_ID=MMETSP0991-20121206/18689_1 /TAXON_ID=483369 /ORGANISM="non described non described, Strain CCMP2098" /LENGTH=116 /DNA_ID=CAMNT_0012305967 /DNA_START=450 /DNA_END=801 /DNA_ORIENTATION=+